MSVLPRSRRLRRLLKAVAAIVVGLPLLAAVAFLLRPLRETVLDYALTRVDAGLPGRFTATEAAWPSPGRLALGSVLWTVDGDTVLSAPRLEAAVALRPLLRRDLEIVSLRAEIALLDAGLLRTVQASGTGKPEEASGPPAFPRPGCLPPVPSLAVREAEAACARLVLDDTLTVVDADLRLRVELRAGRDPALTAASSARDSRARWELVGLDLDWAPSASRAVGHGELSLPGRAPVLFDVEGRGDRGFALALRAAEGEAPPRLDAEGRVTGGGDDAWGLVIDGSFLLPGVAVGRGEGPPLEVRDPAGVFDATVVLEPEGPRGRAGLAFEPGALWSEARAALTFDAGAVVLDTLVVASRDLTLDASGRLRDGLVRGGARLDVTGPGLIAELTGSPSPLEAFGLRADLAVAGAASAPELVLALEALLQAGEARLDRARLDASLDEGWANGRVVWSLEGHGAAVANRMRVRREGDVVAADIEPVRVSRGAEAPRDGAGSTGRLRAEPAAGVVSLEGLTIVDALGAAAVSLRRDASGLDLGVDLRLPAPGAVLPGADLPPRLAELEPITGRVAARVRGDEAEVLVDLGSTPWLDRAVAALSVGPESAALDSLNLAAFGLSVRGGGRLAGERLSGTFVLALPDLRSLDGIASLPPEASGAVDGEVEIAGSPDAPDLAAVFSARYADATSGLPALTGVATASGDSLEVLLRAPDGAAVSGFAFDVVRGGYRGPTPGRGEGRLRLEVAGAELAMRAGGVLSVDEAPMLTADTLSLESPAGGLDLDRPFVLRLEDGGFALEGLALSGGLGRLEGDVRMAGGEPAGRLTCALDVPDGLLPPELAPELRPRRLDAVATLEGPRADVRMSAGGLSLGRRTDVRAVADLRRDGPSMSLAAAVIGGTDSLAVLDVRTVLPPDRTALAGEPLPLAGGLRVRGLPLPLPEDLRADDREVLLDGDVAWSGTTLRPEARLEGSVRALGWPRLEEVRLEVGASLRPGEADALSNLESRAELKQGAATLAEARVALEGFALGAGRTDAAPVLDAVIRTDGLDLERFTSLLPARAGVRGVLDVDLGASGPPGNPDLSGRASLADARITSPDGSWASFAGGVGLEGTASAPRVTGRLTVDGGVIRLPDPPRTLHPVHRRPLLWNDRAPASASASGAPRAALAASAVDPDLTLKASIPAGLWLRGQGLEVELRGELDVGVTAARQTVAGALTATRGSYRFLGRRFEVERGEVDFDAGDPLDPLLDIALTARLDDTLYRIAFGGTLITPTLTLTSDPEMPEGDIMAMLLFGRPVDELSGDQEGLVRDRAKDLVAAYGSAQLEARLSQQLNVDMVSLKQSEEADGAEALVIGKRLNRDVLVIYEQVLDDWAAFFVNLEYQVSRRLKLETMISRQGRSAAAVNWSVDY